MLKILEMKREPLFIGKFASKEKKKRDRETDI